MQICRMTASVTQICSALRTVPGIAVIQHTLIIIDSYMIIAALASSLPFLSQTRPSPDGTLFRMRVVDASSGVIPKSIWGGRKL